MPWARSVCKIFFLLPSKRSPTRENSDKLTNFSMTLNDKIDPNSNFAKIAKCQMSFSLTFLWWKVFFLRERARIFGTYSGPLKCVKSFDCILIQLTTFPFHMENSRKILPIEESIKIQFFLTTTSRSKVKGSSIWDHSNITFWPFSESTHSLFRFAL